MLLILVHLYVLVPQLRAGLHVHVRIMNVLHALAARLPVLMMMAPDWNNKQQHELVTWKPVQI